MEKHYEGSNILFLESGALFESLQPFLPFMVDRTFGKIWNIWTRVSVQENS